MGKKDKYRKDKKDKSKKTKPLKSKRHYLLDRAVVQERIFREHLVEDPTVQGDAQLTAGALAVAEQMDVFVRLVRAKTTIVVPEPGKPDEAAIQPA